MRRSSAASKHIAFGPPPNFAGEGLAPSDLLFVREERHVQLEETRQEQAFPLRRKFRSSMDDPSRRHTGPVSSSRWRRG
jgi:hypothetical protein